MGICATTHQEPIFEYMDQAQTDDAEIIIKYLKLQKSGPDNKYYCNEIKKILKTKPYQIKFVDDEQLKSNNITLHIYNLNGHLCIKKTGYNLVQVARFLRMNLIAQVGVKVVHVVKERLSKDGYTLYMEKLETREKLKYMIINEQYKVEEAYKQLNAIEAKLKEKQIAHCDIKFSNIGLKKGKGELFLIDCGDSRSFGKPRSVYTPVLNITINDAQQIKNGQQFSICDEQTDFLGFENIKMQMHQWLENLETEDNEYLKYAQKQYSKYEKDELQKQNFDKENVSLNHNERITDGSITGAKNYIE